MNTAASLGELRDIIDEFFFAASAAAPKEEALLGDAPDVNAGKECASDETAQGAHPTATGDVFHRMSLPSSSNRHASHKPPNGRQVGTVVPLSGPTREKIWNYCVAGDTVSPAVPSSSSKSYIKASSKALKN